MTSIEILFEKAAQARKNAYAPYSEFKVGAAILSAEGNFYIGANTENVSYPCGLCAEAVAIGSMVSAGDHEIADILIISNAKNLIAPCGACLQRILEFSNKETFIHLADLSGVKKSYKIVELLPVAFNEDLKK